MERLAFDNLKFSLGSLVKRNTVVPANVNPGYLPRMFVECLARSYKALPHLMPIMARSHAMPNMARTQNGEAFLASEAEWILLIDSDMQWEPDAIIRLLKTAKEKKAKAVSGLTFMDQKNRVIPHAYATVPNKEGGKSLAPYAVLPTMDDAFQVDAVGGACFLVHRDIYQDVYDMTKRSTAYYWQEDVYNHKSKAMQGEDLTFSKRIKAAGYDIWYEPRSYWPHEKTVLFDVQEYLDFIEGLNLGATDI